MTPEALEQPARPRSAAIAASMLVALRVLVGGWLALHFVQLAVDGSTKLLPWELFDRTLLDRLAPSTRVSLLRIPFFHHHAKLLWALGGIVGTLLVVGVRVGPAAWVLFTIAVSTARSLYPVTDFVDSVAVHLALWGGLVFSECPGRLDNGVPRWSCAFAAGASALMLASLPSSALTLLPWAVCLMVFMMLSGIALIPRGEATRPLRGSTVAGGTLLFLLAAHAAPVSVTGKVMATSLESFLLDIGVVTPVADIRGQERRRLRLQTGPVETLNGHSLWPQVFRQRRALHYALAAPSARGEGLRARLELQGAARLGLARAACSAGAPGEKTELHDDAGTVAFAFRCLSGQARLVVEPKPLKASPLNPLPMVLRDEAYALKAEFDRDLPTSTELTRYLELCERLSPGLPIQCMLEVADYRFLRHEYEEAARMVDEVYRHASVHTRRRAGLSELRDLVLARLPRGGLRRNDPSR